MGERSEHMPAERPHGSRTAMGPTSITDLAHEAVEALTPLMSIIAFRGHAGRPWPLLRWRSAARIRDRVYQ